MNFALTAKQRVTKDRLPWTLIATLFAATLLLTAILAWFWYARMQAATQRQMALDLLWQEQTIRQGFVFNQHILENWTHDLRDGNPSEVSQFQARVEKLLKENAALVSVDFVSGAGRRTTSAPTQKERPDVLPPLSAPEVTAAIVAAYAKGVPTYSRVFTADSPLWALVIPVAADSSSSGVVVAIYDLNRVLEQEVPWWFVQRYDLELFDADGRRLSPHDTEHADNANDIHTLNFGPETSGLVLYVARHPYGNWWATQGGLLAAITLLGAVVAWLLRILHRRIHERIEARRALSDELRFREAMENSLLTGLVAFDLQGRISYVNPAFCKMVQFDAEELLSVGAPFPFWSSEHLVPCQHSHEMMMQSDSVLDGHSAHYCRKDGSGLTVRLFSSALVDGEGIARGWMVSLYDVTIFLEQREALSVSRAQLYTILAGLEAAVSVSMHEDGRLLFRNSHHSMIFPMQSDGECCLLPWNGVPREPQTHAGDFFDPTNNCWYHLERRTIRWIDGASVQLDIARDITAERRSVQAARERDDLLQHTARLASLAEFASGIAHEINQPLSAIANYTAVAKSFLQSQPLRLDKVLEAVTLAGEESRRTGQIIHSLRGLIQKRRAQHELHNLHDLLSEPLALLAPQLQQHDVDIIVRGPLKSIVIECDAVMIEQVLLNLIRNALEAVSNLQRPLPRDAVVVRVDSDALGVTLCVSDRGTGIADPDRLFKAFYTTKAEGMGLGLAICRTVIESHGGRIWAEPNPKGGTRFSFRLPRPAMPNQALRQETKP
ncbi:MAG: sensor histidine kinase [Rhodocyclales bacterium]|nr:sensor histidine kinase [Rhodocyclales bacterium]MDB5887268.1 sensor histidine kinase [Rhodocyclales bacterium]